MPHLVVEPFDLNLLDKVTDVEYYAQGLRSEKDVLLKMPQFFLEINKKKDLWVIKSDKVSKPASVELIKSSLESLAKGLNLQVVSQNITAKSTPKKSEHLKTVHELKEQDFSDRAVNVEVGFGSGRHLLHQAKQHPNELFIGLEVHSASIQQVIKQAKIQNIDNLMIINYDARLFLELLPSNVCKNIYVHFPVPWDKKPHRRVISDEFVTQSMRVLQKGGVLNLRTDSHNYFLYSFETFFAKKQVDCRVCKNLDIAVSSKYEDRWKRMQKDIYDFYCTSLETSSQQLHRYDFNFKKELDLHRVKFESFKYDNYFIRFENIFQIDPDRSLLKLSFGSFHKPESRYIYIDSVKKEAYYLFLDPINTEANYLAHQKIMEML